MTYSNYEQLAKQLSKIGWRLKLFETSTGWAWQWAIGSNIVLHGSTTAATKPVALVMALESISG